MVVLCVVKVILGHSWETVQQDDFQNLEAAHLMRAIFWVNGELIDHVFFCLPGTKRGLKNFFPTFLQFLSLGIAHVLFSRVVMVLPKKYEDFQPTGQVFQAQWKSLRISTCFCFWHPLLFVLYTGGGARILSQEGPRG